MERKTIEKIEETKEHTLVIEGRNAVLEAFRSGRTSISCLCWTDVRMVRYARLSGKQKSMEQS